MSIENPKFEYSEEKETKTEVRKKDSGISEDNQLSLREKLLAEEKQLNEDVQKNLVMDKYGKKYGFDKEKTYAYVESRIRAIEDQMRSLKKTKTKETTVVAEEIETDDIRTLKSEIEEINEDVQKNLVMDKYGKEFGFNKEDTYSYIEQKIKENEEKIRALEQGSEKTSREREEAIKEAVIDEAVEILAENGNLEAAEVLEAEVKSIEKEFVVDVVPERNTNSTLESESELGSQPKSTAESEASSSELPQNAAETFNQEYEKESKKGSKWNWIKERLKGFVSIGCWEVHHAEKFRKATKDESKDIKKEADRIKQIEDLDYEQAYDEASRIKEIMKINNDSSAVDNYARYSERYTVNKRNENNIIVDAIINESLENLENKLEKYKDEFGETVTTKAKMNAFQKILREQLIALQTGLLKPEKIEGVGIEKEGKQAVSEFKKIIRENLDKNYWRRYVYATAEAAIDFCLLKWAIDTRQSSLPEMNVSEGNVLEINVPDSNVLEGGSTESELLKTREFKKELSETVTLGKGETLWGISNQMLVDSGIENPNNKQIMKGAIELCKDNEVAVKIWKLTGSVYDTAMRIGTTIKVGALKGLIASGLM